MMQHWWMHFPLCPWGWRQGVPPAIALHIAGTWRGNPAFVIVALAVALAIAIAFAISVAFADSVAVAAAVAQCHCRRRRPLPLRLPSTIAAAFLSRCRQPLPLPLPLSSAIAISVTVGHRSCHLHKPSLLPCHQPFPRVVYSKIEAKNSHLIIFCSDSGWHTDQSRMTDQVSSGDGHHQRWAASGKQWAASEGSG